MTSSEGPIRVAVLCGSVRPHNYTRMAANVVVASLAAEPDVSVQVVDAAELDLPLPGMEASSKSVSELQEVVRGSTAVVLATPEYHGSFSSVMKLMIENLGFPSALQGKTVSLLGVAAGSIGAIKSLEQLQSVCSHVGAIVLPGPVSVAHVRRAFNDDGECVDSTVEGRLQGLAEGLLGYIHRHLCPRMTLEAMVRDE
jgi:NAD(P)H-dependent FMN reductase